jgi:hypothetical protein
MDQIDPKIVGSIVVASLSTFAWFLSQRKEKTTEKPKKTEIDKAKRWIKAHFTKMKEILAAVELDFQHVSNEISAKSVEKDSVKSVGKKEIGAWDQTLIRLLERVDLVKTSQGSVDESIGHVRGEKWDSIKQKLQVQFNIDDVVGHVDGTLDEGLESVKLLKRSLLERIQTMHDTLDEMAKDL